MDTSLTPEFWHINIGNLLTIVAFIVGGLGFVWTMKKDMAVIGQRLQYVEASNDDQKEEIKKLAGILITLGRYDERFLRVEGQLDDLRHGRGFIDPDPRR